MSDIKWSAFPSTATYQAGDKLVGIHGANNSQFPISFTPAASTVMMYDANSNSSANNYLSGYATTITAAGTTTLTVASAYHQNFTGTTTQTVVMPAAATLAVGQSWKIENNSTGNITINANGGSTILILFTGEVAILEIIGVTDSDWDAALIVAGALLANSNNTNLTTNTAANVAQLTLPKGNWDCYGSVNFGTGTGNINQISAGINTVNNVIPGANTNFNFGVGAGSTNVPVPYFSITSTGSQNLCLVALAVFGSGSVNGSGTLYARRAKLV